jgi:hypothetical protein
LNILLCAGLERPTPAIDQKLKSFRSERCADQAVFVSPFFSQEILQRAEGSKSLPMTVQVGQKNIEIPARTGDVAEPFELGLISLHDWGRQHAFDL